MARTTRALTLTEEGLAYYRAAERILQDLNEADRAVATETARGRIRVNASVPFGTSFVGPSVGRFLQNHPNLTVDLSFTDEVVNLFEEKADVAIRVGDLPDSTLKARKLAQSRRVVCAAPDYLRRHGTRSPRRSRAAQLPDLQLQAFADRLAVPAQAARVRAACER